tara:strand:+ start:70 stop:945 length:876 start_codon:yes stop_codon:yes gene_type:complete
VIANKVANQYGVYPMRNCRIVSKVPSVSIEPLNSDLFYHMPIQMQQSVSFSISPVTNQSVEINSNDALYERYRESLNDPFFFETEEFEQLVRLCIENGDCFQMYLKKLHQYFPLHYDGEFDTTFNNLVHIFSSIIDSDSTKNKSIISFDISEYVAFKFLSKLEHSSVAGFVDCIASSTILTNFPGKTFIVDKNYLMCESVDDLLRCENLGKELKMGILEFNKFLADQEIKIVESMKIDLRLDVTSEFNRHYTKLDKIIHDLTDTNEQKHQIKQIMNAHLKNYRLLFLAIMK